MNKRLFLNLMGLTIMVMALTMCKSQSAVAPSTPQEALAELIAGNERYVSEKTVHPRGGMDRVAETAPHQAPFAAVVGCSDSRVPVELLFDQGIGDIFVIRTAGNNVNSEMVMGSVDYAIEHLGVKSCSFSDMVRAVELQERFQREKRTTETSDISSQPSAMT